MENVIVLYRDHTCKSIEVEDLYDVKDICHAKMVLYNVGMYSPQYIMIDPDDVPRKFDFIHATYTLTLEICSDDGWVIMPCDNQEVDCDSLAKLYKFTHSINTLEGRNIVFGRNDFGNYSEFGLDSFKIACKRKDKNKYIDAKALADKMSVDSQAARGCDFVKRVINKAVNRDMDDNIIDEVSKGLDLYIDVKHGRWGTKKFATGEQLMAVPLSNVNSYAFIPPKDYEILEEIDTCEMSFMVFLMTSEKDLPVEMEKLNSGNIYEFEDFAEVITDEMNRLYGAEEILEAVLNLKHAFLCFLLWDEIYHGFIDSKIIVELRYVLKKDGRHERFFDITKKIADEEDDFYDSFMAHVESSINEREYENGRNNRSKRKRRG